MKHVSMLFSWHHHHTVEVVEPGGPPLELGWNCVKTSPSPSPSWPPPARRPRPRYSRWPAGLFFPFLNKKETSELTTAASEYNSDCRYIIYSWLIDIDWYRDTKTHSVCRYMYKPNSKRGFFSSCILYTITIVLPSCSCKFTRFLKYFLEGKNNPTGHLEQRERGRQAGGEGRKEREKLFRSSTPVPAAAHPVQPPPQYHAGAPCSWLAGGLLHLDDVREITLIHVSSLDIDLKSIHDFFALPLPLKNMYIMIMIITISHKQYIILLSFEGIIGEGNW